MTEAEMLIEIEKCKHRFYSIFGRAFVSIIVSHLLGFDHAGHLGTFFMYAILSYVWVFIKVAGNYILGTIAFFIALYFVYEKVQNEVIFYILLFGGVILDAYNVIKYIVLKRKLRGDSKKSIVKDIVYQSPIIQPSVKKIDITDSQFIDKFNCINNYFTDNPAFRESRIEPLENGDANLYFIGSNGNSYQIRQDVFLQTPMEYLVKEIEKAFADEEEFAL